MYMFICTLIVDTIYIYIYTLVCVYIYIYIYIYISGRGSRRPGGPHRLRGLAGDLRLMLSLLGFVDSSSPGDSLWTPYGHEDSTPQFALY